MTPQPGDIFQRMQAGEPLRKDDPEYARFGEVVARTIRLCVEMNATVTEVDDVRQRLSEITGQDIDPSTAIFPPFHTNFGRFIRLGKNVFINHACSFLDISGITIESDRRSGQRADWSAREPYIRKPSPRPRRPTAKP